MICAGPGALLALGPCTAWVLPATTGGPGALLALGPCTAWVLACNHWWPWGPFGPGAVLYFVLVALRPLVAWCYLSCVPFGAHGQSCPFSMCGNCHYMLNTFAYLTLGVHACFLL